MLRESDLLTGQARAIAGRNAWFNHLVGEGTIDLPAGRPASTPAREGANHVPPPGRHQQSC